MNVELFIAKRYLLSKKKRNVINIISIISVIGVATVTMALIVILSVFNGFDGMVKSMFNYFAPNIKIMPAKGKSFEADARFVKIKNLSQVSYYSEVIEENVLLQYGDKQHIGKIKGVEENYKYISGLDTALTEGEFALHKDELSYAVIGYGVAYYLSLSLINEEPLTIWAPKIGAKVSMNPDKDFVRKKIMPSGVFSINQEFDVKYVITPIQFARELLDYGNKISFVEIKLNEKLSESEKDKIKLQIKQILGSDFEVKNRYEQQQFLNQIMNSEKIAIFLILSFILIIASFNIIGSITMLIIEKREDIETLKSMGASKQFVSKIFMYSGWLISGSGAFIGFFLGVALLLAQIQFSLVTFPINSLMVTAYPVEMQFWDFIFVFVIVLLIGFLASIFPVKRILNYNFEPLS